MGVVEEAVHELLDVLVDHRMVVDFLIPMRELGGGGQLPVQQQIGDLGVFAVLR